MTLRNNLESLEARKRAIENATISDLCSAIDAVSNACPGIRQHDTRLLVGFAYPAGVVDGKRAERAMLREEGGRIERIKPPPIIIEQTFDKSL